MILLKMRVNLVNRPSFFTTEFFRLTLHFFAKTVYVHTYFSLI